MHGFGLIFLTVSACFSHLWAEGNNTKTTKTAPAEAPSENPSKAPEATQNVDPNKPDSAKIDEKKADPNNPQDTPGQENNDNDFSPKLSTLIRINETFEKLFNPELVTDDGLVHYSTLRRKRGDLIMTAASELKNINPAVLMTLSKEQRIAFWVNTYNVCTLKLIIDNYPIEPKLYMIFYPNNSIMQISGDWRTKHFFDIQGLEYNLEEIEQELLLERYKDPRIYFALSYASQGGAILRNEPYTAEKLNDQLDDQVRRYLQSPHGFELDKEKNILYLSNLFTMFGHKELFLSSKYAAIKKFRDRKPEERAWLNFIRAYLSKDDARYLENTPVDMRFIKYDWALNEAP